MIVGLGLDVAEIARIRKAWDRFGPRFAQRILAPGELAALPPQPVPYLAARFAAKEAAVKALGTGFSNGIGPCDIEVISLPTGQPTVRFHGAAAARFAALGGRTAHVSLTHGRDTAAAVVVLED